MVLALLIGAPRCARRAGNRVRGWPIRGFKRSAEGCYRRAGRHALVLSVTDFRANLGRQRAHIAQLTGTRLRVLHAAQRPFTYPAAEPLHSDV